VLAPVDPYTLGMTDAESPPEGQDLPTRRYLALVSQLGDIVTKQRGWKAAVARVLDVDKAYISLLTRETDARQSVGGDAIQRAVDALKLPMAYFTDPTLGTAPDYRDHTTRRPLVRIMRRTAEPERTRQRLARVRDEIASLKGGIDWRSKRIAAGEYDDELPTGEREAAELHLELDRSALERAQAELAECIKILEEMGVSPDDPPAPVEAVIPISSAGGEFGAALTAARLIARKQASGMRPSRREALTLAYAILSIPLVAKAHEIIEAEQGEGDAWLEPTIALVAEMMTRSNENKS
jgi:hypothetical protein